MPDNSLFCNWCGHSLLKQKRKPISIPKARQLSSGSWRIQLRREGVSITHKSKTRVEEEARAYRKKWLEEEALGLHAVSETVTLGKVIDNYISAKTKIVSPSTLTAYQSIRDHRLQSYMNVAANSINWQEAVNGELDDGVSVKTAKNVWGLCSSALRYAGITAVPPSFPRSVKAERNWLDYKQIITFLSLIEGEPYELCALLALHSLRRSEIFGLRPTDYDREKQIIHIRGAMLHTDAGWIRTDLNKNDTSRRDVPIIIPRLAELLNAADPGIQYYVKPSSIIQYSAINKVCREAGLPEPGLHGLRHSFASLAYHLNWKKKSTEAVGGWRNSKILDAIYTHNADLEDDVKAMRSFYE